MDISPSSPTPVALRLKAVLGCLRAALGGWGLEAVLAVQLYRRVGEIIRQIEPLLLRFRAGTLRRRTTRTCSGPAATEGEPSPARPRPPRVKAACRAGWLLRAGRHHAAVFTAQLQSILEEPEMTALLAASPAALRLFKPLCRALAVDLPILRPPPRPAKPRTRKRRTPRPMPDLGRIPLPRGVLTAARRQGFGKW